VVKALPSELKIRRATKEDYPAWIAMRRQLWHDQDPAEMAREAYEMPTWDPPCVEFLAEAPDGQLVGFIEVGIRSLAEGCPQGPTAYIEGVFVEQHARRLAVANQLLAVAEQWAIDRGFSHLGSDARLHNDVSHSWHRAAGFAEIERIVAFAKPLARNSN